MRTNRKPNEVTSVYPSNELVTSRSFRLQRMARLGRGQEQLEITRNHIYSPGMDASEGKTSQLVPQRRPL